MKMNMKEINLNDMEKTTGAGFTDYPPIPMDAVPAPVNPCKPDFRPFPIPPTPETVADIDSITF